MAKYTYKSETGKYAIIRPDGSLADWPLCDTEEEAQAVCRDMNRPDDEWFNEARWQARMAGDME